ncbi:methyltransferase-like protein 27 [Plectropomus leopardus]|uniref:methyltransferase-like protein 27 n=1 Tax=Plectropomus leopardus TaxID=160734 RepID=UPI001C4BC224|nr:methyltransferase-like protein 27 [Plectropomus leopardus]
MSNCSRTLDDVRTLIQSKDRSSSEQTMKFYDKWAETYQQDVEMIQYKAPKMVVNLLNANFTGSHEEALVLDVACGSGLVAKLMSELGFRHFVGVDCSEAMLKEADKTGLYRELKQALLGTDKLPAQNDMFDVVMIVGALLETYVPVSVVRELCHAAKPGGYVCMSSVDHETVSGHEYTMSLEREMKLMEGEGLWTPVDTKEMDKWLMDPFSGDENKQNEKYLSGTMYLYRKSVI